MLCDGTCQVWGCPCPSPARGSTQVLQWLGVLQGGWRLPLCLTLPWDRDNFCLCLVLLLGWANTMSLFQQSQVALGMAEAGWDTGAGPGWCPQGTGCPCGNQSCPSLPGDVLSALEHWAGRDHPSTMVAPASTVAPYHLATVHYWHSSAAGGTKKAWGHPKLCPWHCCPAAEP